MLSHFVPRERERERKKERKRKGMYLGLTICLNSQMHYLRACFNNQMNTPRERNYAHSCLPSSSFSSRLPVPLSVSFKALIIYDLITGCTNRHHSCCLSHTHTYKHTHQARIWLMTLCQFVLKCPYFPEVILLRSTNYKTNDMVQKELKLSHSSSFVVFLHSDISILLLAYIYFNTQINNNHVK